MLTKAFLASLLLALAGCGESEESLEVTQDPISTLGSGSALIHATRAETGNVFLTFFFPGAVIAQGTRTDPLKMGPQLATSFKSILSFDTSMIPQNAKITYVNLNVALDEPDTEKIYYTWRNMQIDFAGPFGFGGSDLLTPFDYSAPAAKSFVSTIGNAAIGGLQLNLDYNQNPRDLTPYFNKGGTTQIRLAFAQNPARYLAKWVGATGSDPSLSPVSLFVAWETPARP